MPDAVCGVVMQGRR